MNSKNDRFRHIDIKVVNYQTADAVKVESSEDCYKILLSLLEREDNSYRQTRNYWIVALNDDDYVLCVYTFTADLDSLMKVSMRQMLLPSFNAEASKIVLAYNVKDGENLIPEGENSEFFNKAFNFADYLELEVLDTMVISPSGFHSDREDDYLKYYKHDKMFKLVYDVQEKLEQSKVKFANKQSIKNSNRVRKDIAKFMISSGESIDKVMVYTGLNTEEVEALQKK